MDMLNTCMNATQFSSSICNGLVAVEMISPWCKIDCQKFFTCRKSAVRARVVTKVLRRRESLWICWTLCINATEVSSCMWNGNDAVETMSPWCSGYHICLTRRRSAVRARVVTKVLRRSESLWICWTLAWTQHNLVQVFATVLLLLKWSHHGVK